MTRQLSRRSVRGARVGSALALCLSMSACVTVTTGDLPVDSIRPSTSPTLDDSAAPTLLVPTTSAETSQLPPPPATPTPTQSPTQTPTSTSVQSTPEPTRQPEPTPSPSPSASPSPTLPTDATLDEALARCPTAAEVAFVDKRIELTFNDDPTAPKLVCRTADGSADLTLLQERAYQAVLALRWIRFDARLPWTDRAPLAWFVRAAKGLRFEYADFSHYSLSDEVIVVRSNADMSWDKDQYWISRDPDHLYGLAGLVGLLVHEARHGDGYFHTCAYSEEAGGYGDDQTMEEMGAWAANALYFKWIAEHSDVEYMTPIDAPSELYRERAAHTAEYLTENRICENYEDGPSS
jgi:hypothetical protein